MRSRVLPFLALVLAIVIFFGYTSPLYSGSVSTHKTTIMSDNQALAAAADYQQKAQELTNAENGLDQQQLSRVSVLLPDSVDNVGIIVDLTALAARSGVSLSSINVAPQSADTTGASTDAAGGTSVSSVDLSLSATGTYASFLAFLHGIETSQRLLDVTGVTVAGSDTGVYTYQVSLRLYWLR